MSSIQGTNNLVQVELSDEVYAIDPTLGIRFPLEINSSKIEKIVHDRTKIPLSHIIVAESISGYFVSTITHMNYQCKECQ